MIKNSDKCQEKFLQLLYMLYKVKSVDSTIIVKEIWDTNNVCKTNNLTLVCKHRYDFIGKDDEFINKYKYFLRISIKRDLLLYNKIILNTNILLHDILGISK